MIPENRLDLVRSYSRRYKAASRKEKSRLLDSFYELIEYNRKYAIGVLRAGPPQAKSKKCAPRPAARRYGTQAVEYLLLVWRHPPTFPGRCA